MHCSADPLNISFQRSSSLGGEQVYLEGFDVHKQVATGFGVYKLKREC